MTALPLASDFTASTTTEGQMKTAITAQRAFLAGLLGTDGIVATALATLGVLGGAYFARATAYTVQIADRGKLIAATTTWTMGLPPVGSAGAGFSVILANLGAGVITADGSGAELVDGVATVAIPPGCTVILMCSGTDWSTHWLISPAAALTLKNKTFDVTNVFTLRDDRVTLQDNGDATKQGIFDLAGLTTGTTRTLNWPNKNGTALVDADKQTSAFDTTAGALLTVFAAGGSYGWGNLASNVVLADFDSATIASGVWRFNNTTIGTRPAAVGAGISGTLIQTVSAAAQQHQIMLSGNTNQALYLRRWNGTAWSAWAELWSQATALGTVAQASGVPTGAIIERGSNANGEYARFADGSLECYRTLAAATGAAVTWTFPSAFIAAPVVTGNAVATVLSAVCLDAAPSTTAATFSARDKTDARRADTCHLCAVGRWF